MPSWVDEEKSFPAWRFAFGRAGDVSFGRLGLTFYCIGRRIINDGAQRQAVRLRQSLTLTIVRYEFP